MKITWSQKSCGTVFFNIFILFSISSFIAIPPHPHSRPLPLYFFSMRPKARGLAQHGGPPAWLGESDPAGWDFVHDGRPCRLPWQTTLFVQYRSRIRKSVTGGIKSTLPWGCRTGPPAYVACRSQLPYIPQWWTDEFCYRSGANLLLNVRKTSHATQGRHGLEL